MFASKDGRFLDWTRFVDLWRPQTSPNVAGSKGAGGLIVLHEGTKIRKLLHTKVGRIPPFGPWPVDLAGLAREHKAAWAVAAEVGALEEVMERFGARALRSDDFSRQAISLATIVREMIGEGLIRAWPMKLHGLPPPTQGMAQRVIDSLCEDGRSILLGLFAGGDLWTAFVACRRGAGFDVIAGPDELRAEMGLLSGDWRRDYRHLVRAVEERYAPLSFGCFAELDTFRELQVDARPGAWGRSIALRDVILSPIPSAVGLALGVDAVRYALGHVRAAVHRMDRFGVVAPAVRTIRAKLSSKGEDERIMDALGFDPMAVLRALLRP